MTSKSILAFLCLAALMAAASAAADDGHNHDAAPVAPSGPALPRFAALSEGFELVGIVNGKELTVYLDRFADNSPVRGAKVDLEVGGAKVELKEHEPGEFEGALAQELKPGVTAVTATVVAGNETDILAGELDVHEETHAVEDHRHGGRKYAVWGAGALAVLAAVAWGGRRVVAARRVRKEGAA